MGKSHFYSCLDSNIHTPSMSPYLPVTPGAIDRGGCPLRTGRRAVVHIHARKPEDGSPTTDVNLYRQILSGIKARSNLVVSPTTGGTATMTPEQRIAVVRELKPEMATFNAGSFNFALYPWWKK